MKNDEGEKTTVRSLERGLTILNYLAEDRGRPKGITEISKNIDLAKGTVHRLITTLQKCGFVDKDYDGEKYRLGLKLMELGGIVKEALDIRKQAEPILKKLGEVTKLTVHLALLIDSEIVYIDKVESQTSIQMASYIGQRSYIHSTSLGKAICAYLPEEETIRHLNKKGMPRLTNQTITTVEDFKEHLKEVRSKGYAVDENENEESIRCIASTVLDNLGRPIGAVSISGTVMQITKDKVEEMSVYVVKAAKEISKRMGYV